LNYNKAKQHGGTYKATPKLNFMHPQMLKVLRMIFFSYLGGDPLGSLDLVRSLFFADSTLIKSLGIHRQAKKY